MDHNRARGQEKRRNLRNSSSSHQSTPKKTKVRLQLGSWLFSTCKQFLARGQYPRPLITNIPSNEDTSLSKRLYYEAWKFSPAMMIISSVFSASLISEAFFSSES